MKHLFLIKSSFVILLNCCCTNLILAQNVCTADYFRSGHTSLVSAQSGFLTVLPSGEYIYNANAFFDDCIVKTDKKGDLLWAKKYSAATPLYGDKLKGALDKDGNIVSSIKGDVLIITNQNGNVLTSKRLIIPSQNVVIEGIAVSPDNDKIVLLNDQSTYSKRGYMLVRLSPDLSTIKWLKHFSDTNLFLSEIEVTDNRILICGSKNQKGMLMIFELSTGNLSYQREVWFNSGGAVFNTLHFKKYNRGYIAMVESFNGVNISRAILRFDQNLNQINSYFITPFTDEQKFKLLVDSSGSITACATGHTEFFTFLRITVNDSIVVSKKGQTAWWSNPSDFKQTTSGFSLVSFATYNAVGIGNFGFTMLTSFDPNGSVENNLSCGASDVVINRLPCNNTMLPTALQARDTTFLSLQSIAVTVSDKTFFSSNKSCFRINECNDLKIEGITSFCRINSTIFKGKKNANCSAPINWKISGTGSRIDVLNDSAALFTFSQSGTYSVIASIDNLCETISDTINVSVTLSGLTLSIGSDFSLCPSNTKLLNAKTGFVSYRWQDGSTDSTYLVTQPGTYYVTARDACDSLYTDTVVVTAAPPVPLSIGPDKTKCNNDTLQINAPSGFLNYTWGPNYNISNTTSQNVIVNPATDTVYYIKAEKTPGCFGFDTIRIKVNTSPPINLGPDRSFCSGDSILLNAGSGFSTYQWSNGNNAQSITVKTAGAFSIKASTIQGCASVDTMRVLNVYNNPVVTLNKDTGLCIGTVRTLDAGSFNGYLWNNGNTTRSISVNNIGIYTVVVTDNNGCRGTDSSRITTLYSAPTTFLQQDTAICSYGKLDLFPTASFSSYLWSNNAISKSITISQPGLYWLRVKDLNNCIGTDSIRVNLKECLSGFYMPTAFTPDGNGLNDDLKPFLFGNIKTYLFTVYNRWGQLVFQSNDRLRGWDGRYKGIDADPGTYTWTCNYQLDGSPVVLQKGTVILIR